MTPRIHIALAVRDLDASRAFYRVLFQSEPTKERPGYAKFEPGNPSLNLTLNQATEAPTAKTHYGIEVGSTEEVTSAIQRLQDAGLATEIEEQTTCCYAVQDKVWVNDPDGNPWEVFVVTDADAPTHSGPAPEESVTPQVNPEVTTGASACCEPDSCC